MFAYITASSFIFVDQIGFSQLQYAFLFGFNITGIIIFTILNTYFLRKYSSYKLLKAFTLVACISGFYLLLISLLNFHHPFYLIIGLLMFVGVTGAIGANAIANLLNIFFSSSRYSFRTRGIFPIWLRCLSQLFYSITLSPRLFTSHDTHYGNLWIYKFLKFENK